MHPEILLCVSQEENAVPYKFKTTGIQVFSLEEALYHTFHYWKQSIDDFLSEDFIKWVNDTLCLSFVGARIKAMTGSGGFGEKLISFLTVIDYFDPKDIKKLKGELDAWEKRLEWERLKERGDYLIHKSEPAKALMLYKKALTFGENQQLLNNTGVALLQLEQYEEAVRILERALSRDDTNIQILLNLAEAVIYKHDFEKAQEILQRAKSLSQDNSDIAYLFGEMYFEAGNMSDAIKNYENAILLRNDEQYVCRLTDVYVKMRQYDKALEVLSKTPKKDSDFLMKQAQVYVNSGNVPAAIKSIEKALIYNKDNVELWISLAMYHRLDYDLNRASSAIRKALSLDPDNDRAKLEHARINKGLGKMKDYQIVLNHVLKGFKRKYRETYAE